MSSLSKPMNTVYPRLTGVQIALVTPVTGAGNHTSEASFLYATLIRALKIGGVAVAADSLDGTDPPSSSTCTAFGISPYLFDPAIEELSFVAVQLVASTNWDIARFLVNARELTHGALRATTTTSLSDSFTIVTVANAGLRIGTLTNPPKPRDIMFDRGSNLRLGASTIGVVAGAEVPLFNIGFWITPRQDLAK